MVKIHLMITFSTKDLENFCAIKAHTIRTWEQRFSILKPQRSGVLRREYSISELRLLLDVCFLNRNGFKISRIAKMTASEMAAAVNSLTTSQQKQDKAVSELISCMAVMDLEGFNMILRSCELAWGLNETISQVVAPFLQRAGLLEQRAINKKASLVLVEQCIRQKMIIAVEKNEPMGNGRPILFLWTPESNDLELLLLQYSLRVNGITTFYISTNVSTEVLNEVAATVKPSVIISSFSHKKKHFNVPAFSQFLSVNLPQTHLLNLMEPSFVAPVAKQSGTGDDVAQVLQLLNRKRAYLVAG